MWRLVESGRPRDCEAAPCRVRALVGMPFSEKLRSAVQYDQRLQAPARQLLS